MRAEQTAAGKKPRYDGRCRERSRPREGVEPATRFRNPDTGQVIVDDVITAGTSVRESVELIRNAGATPVGVLIALDRMERSGPDDALSADSAVQNVEATYDMPVLAIANLNDLLRFLNSESSFAAAARSFLPTVQAYRERYGA